MFFSIWPFSSNIKKQTKKIGTRFREQTYFKCTKLKTFELPPTTKPAINSNDESRTSRENSGGRGGRAK
jgi:hypothetical protein